MKILRSNHLGMCFGVRDAVTLALGHSESRPITILGDLVHNESVLSNLRKRGVKIERHLSEVQTPAVMITAHGVSQKTVDKILQRGLTLVDATCPLVKNSHQTVAKLVREKFHPVIVGQRDHAEVRGITEDLIEFDVILSDEDIFELQERPRFGVMAQTTQPINRVRRLVALLRERFPNSEVGFMDTVCQPTKQRQVAAAELSRQCDAVVVIGGTNSNNTRELVATCSQHCGRVHHVQNAEDMSFEWFQRNDTVGITAGTSTPDEVIREVERWLIEWIEFQNRWVTRMPDAFP